MRRSKRSLPPMAVLVLAAVLSPALRARPVSALDYQKLFSASDLVVIAAPLNRTAETKERTVLRDLVRAENDRTVPIKVTGVETRFRVPVVLKGYRQLAPPAVEVNGPRLGVLRSFQPIRAALVASVSCP